jgi:ABC-2 type transport system ATP-binding protein
MIETIGLHKRFGKRKVLDGLDLTVAEGDIFGFIGENGAGKTTTVKILMGLEHPQAGTARVLGADCSEDIAATRARIGFASETVFPPGHLTVAEAVRFHSRFYPSWDEPYAQSLLKTFALDPKAVFRQLSRGQQARVKLLLAFAQRPALLIIDEVTAGLDALARHDLVGQLKELIAAGGSTIFFATNLLYDLEKVATKVALLEDGKAALTASVAEMTNTFRRISFRSLDALALLPAEAVRDKSFDETGAHVVMAAADWEAMRANPGVAAFSPTVSPLDLESAFVHLVRRDRERPA